jgi:hypothetical protein
VKLLIFITILFFLAYVPLRWSATAQLRRHIGPGFVISWLVPVALGLMTHSGPPYLFVVLVLFLATTTSRLDAACRFGMLCLLLPQVSWSIRAGSIYLFDLNTVSTLGLGVLIKNLVKPDGNKGVKGKLTPEDAIVAVLLMIIWVGSGRFPSFTAFLRNGVAAGLLLVLPYLVVRKNLRTSEDFMRFTACFAIAAAIVATFAIYETRFGWVLFDSFRTIGHPEMLSNAVYSRGGALRAASTMNGALMLAIALIIGLVATLYSRRYVREEWMLGCWGVVIFLGLLMAQSRGNTALLPVAVLIFCIQRKKYGYAAAIAVAAPVGLGVLLVAANFSAKIAGFLQIGVNGGGVAAKVYDYRQLLLHRGMEVAATHRWFGQSIDDVLAQLADITQGQHIVDLVNSYLTFYLVSGLAGLVPLGVLFAIILWKLGTTRIGRAGGAALADMRGFALTGLIIIAVQLTFISFIDRVPLLLVVGLAGARLLRIERGKSRRLGDRAASVKPAPAALSAKHGPVPPIGPVQAV